MKRGNMRDKCKASAAKLVVSRAVAVSKIPMPREGQPGPELAKAISEAEAHLHAATDRRFRSRPRRRYGKQRGQ